MLSILALAVVAQAQAPGGALESRNPYLVEAVQALRALEDDVAAQKLDQARRWPDNSPRDLALIHMYEGLVHAGRADEARARAFFKDALLLDPAVRLPSDASPRVRAWWTDLGGQVQSSVLPESTPPSDGAPPGYAPSVTVLREGSRETARTGLRVAGGVTLAAGIGASIGAGVMAGQASSLVSRSSAEPQVGAAVALHQQAQATYQRANWLAAGGAVLAVVGGGLLVYSFGGP